MSTSVVTEGQILAGKYQVDRVIGEGGMGVVVAARHLHLDEPVAIKFLLPEVAKNAEAVERFAREGRASIKIKSEHVVRVMDVGTLEDGIPYMVMEFLRGGDLSALIAHRAGPLQVAEAVEYVLQACEALADAHVLGIVHRDLKPANLFLTTRSDGSPCVKVLDFGISKHTGAGSSGFAMTKTTAVMGSPLYMSPEQMASSRNVDARSDIWALGAILYELLAGRPPFNGETLPQVCSAIIQDQPEPLRATRPEIPEGLERAIFKALEKRREDRFQNIAELAVALAPFAPARASHSAERIVRVLSAVGLTSATLASPVEPSAAVGAQTAGAWAQTQSRTKPSNKPLVIASAVGALALVAVVSVFAVRALTVDNQTKASADPVALSAPPRESAPVVSAETSATALSAVATASNAPVQPALSATAAVATATAATPTKADAKADGKSKPTTTASKKPPARGKGLDAFSDNK